MRTVRVLVAIACAALSVGWILIPSAAAQTVEAAKPAAAQPAPPAAAPPPRRVAQAAAPVAAPAAPAPAAAAAAAAPAEAPAAAAPPPAAAENEPPAVEPPAEAAPEPEAEEEPPDNDDKRIEMDFQDVDLPVLVKFISEITRKNFIIDDRVKGKVTVISPSRISVDEAYAVFQSVLQVKGFTTVPSGPIIKIVASKDAKTSTVPTVGEKGSFAPVDEYITRLVPLENVPASALLPVIQPLISPDGLITVYEPTNTFIIIDTSANIDRLRKILFQLDVESTDKDIEVIRLTHAYADEIASKIAEVLDDGSGGGPSPAAPVAPAAQARTSARARAAARAVGGAAGAGAITGGEGERSYKIVPDDRTNSLIVIAPPIEMRRIRELVARLDVPLPLGTGRIHVYYLRHANSEELVSVLGDLIGGGGGGLGGGLGGRNNFGGFRSGRSSSGFGSSRGGFGTTGSSSRGSSFGGLDELDSGSSFGGSSSGRLGSSSRRNQLGGRGLSGGFGGGSAGTSGSPQDFFEGEVRITADPATNSLIINASPQDFETIKQVIEKLDVRRRQVYVEAIILEVDLDRARSLGIAWQGATGLGDAGVGIGRFNFTQSNLGTLATNPVLGGVPGLILAAASSQTIRLPDGSVIPAQAAVLTATQIDADFNILSAPNLLTTDNQEAEIVGGKNIPFIASTSTSEANLSNTFQTVERRDVGITLRITPQISEGGTVRLDIFQEVSDITEVPGIDANQVGPATTIRSTTTTVVARDGQTVVIGGIISDTIRNSEQKIPYIGDIPVIGNLAKTRNYTRNKINLLIFLTPHIVRNEFDQEKYSKIERDKMIAYLKEQRIPDKRRAQLEAPSWDTANLPPPPKPGARGGRVSEEEDAGIGPSGTAVPASDTAAAMPAAAQLGSVPAGEEPVIESAKYVLLASIWENGGPPPNLESTNNMLALVLPSDSRLRQLFRAGHQYRFDSETFDAVYRCLDTFPTSQAAFALYPEGLRLSTRPRQFLHWQELSDPIARNVVSWSEEK